MLKWLVPSFVCLMVISCAPTSGVGRAAPVSLGKDEKVEDLPVAWAKPNIYWGYNPKGDSTFMPGWTQKFDASGIAFNDKRTCTLVTRQHVVMARHYKRPVGARCVFHDRRGKMCSRKLVRVIDVHGDIAMGLLGEPVPAGYKAYPLLKPEQGLQSKLKGEFVLVTDQNRRLFVHEVAAVKAESIRFTFVAEKQVGFGKKLVAGDSGNPSFVIVNGEPVLLETHTSGGWGAGPFYGSELVQARLQQAIDQLGGGYQLRTVRWR